MSLKKLAKKISKVLFILSLITLLGAGIFYLIYLDRQAYIVASQTPSASEPAAVADWDAETATAANPNADATAPDTPAPQTDDRSDAATAEVLPAEEIPQKPRTITLMAVGDNLMHMGVVRTGQLSDNTFDYTFLFRGISEFLETADIKIINQETILGGNHLGFSGFPNFNSPVEVGDSVAAAGFNVVLHASNHAADQGLAGLNNCISFWETHPEVLMVGIHEKETADTRKKIPILTIEDTAFAILNYTYSPNTEIIPRDIQGRLNMLCAYNENSGRLNFTALNPRVISDIRAAKELADVVIVCPHWGTEYVTKPSRFQQEFAMQMTEAGADLIIGTHPHVVQPVEWIEAENGNRALCFYSLGNYVSTQKDPISLFEALAWVTFEVTDEGVSISNERSGAVPLVCQYTSGPVRIDDIYLLENYTEDQAAAHGVRYYGYGVLTLPDLMQWQEEILGDAVLTSEQILNQ